MTLRRPLQALVVAALASLCLGGCAGYRACKMHGCPDDARITRGVEAGIALHPALGAPNLVRVQTLDRVVYLSGRVDTDLELRLAGTVALEVAGVDHVVNSIALPYSGY